MAFRDEADGAHDLARRAEAALEAVIFDKGRLDRVELVVRCQTLDGGDRRTVMGQGKGKAGIDATAIDENGAGAALAAVAALFGAGQMEAFAQEIEKRDARIVEFDPAERSTWIKSLPNPTTAWTKAADARGEPGKKVLEAYRDKLKAAGFSFERDYLAE